MSLNPFDSPSETKKKSVEAIVKTAKDLNENLAAGLRRFNIPIGIAKAVAQALREAKKEDSEVPWAVKVTASAEAPDNMRTLTISHPDDALEEEPAGG